MRRYFRLSDIDRDSYLNFNEFQVYYKRLRPNTVFARRSMPRRLWMIAFRAYDKDQDGYCSWDEVWKRAMISKRRTSKSKGKTRARSVTPSTVTVGMDYAEYSRVVKKMFTEQSRINNGYLDLKEFKKLYVAVRPATQMDPTDSRQLTAWKSMFRLYDRNQDSSISWSEAWHYFKFQSNTKQKKEEQKIKNKK